MVEKVKMTVVEEVEEDYRVLVKTGERVVDSGIVDNKYIVINA